MNGSYSDVTSTSKFDRNRIINTDDIRTQFFHIVTLYVRACVCVIHTLCIHEQVNSVWNMECNIVLLKQNMMFKFICIPILRSNLLNTYIHMFETH